MYRPGSCVATGGGATPLRATLSYPATRVQRIEAARHRYCRSPWGLFGIDAACALLARVDGDRRRTTRPRRARGAHGHGTQSIQQAGDGRESSRCAGGPALVSLTPRAGGALGRSPSSPLPQTVPVPALRWGLAALLALCVSPSRPGIRWDHAFVGQRWCNGTVAVLATQPS